MRVCMRVLIVEDDFTTKILLSQYLKPYFECHSADNGLIGYNKFIEGIEKNEPFDLVCLDIMMPEMDGLEFLEKIREYEQENEVKKANVIILSALETTNEVAQAYFQGGCSHYMVKPIDKQLLIRVLRDELNLIE